MINITLAEYKRQAQEIAEILISFSEEEEEGFAKTLMGRYREFREFNAKALECKNLAEFKSFADENGIKFDSDEEANELFLGLSKGKKEVEKAILNAEEMSAVSGGNPNDSIDLSILPKDNTERMMQVGPAQAAPLQPGNGFVNFRENLSKAFVLGSVVATVVASALSFGDIGENAVNNALNVGAVSGAAYFLIKSLSE